MLNMITYYRRCNIMLNGALQSRITAAAACTTVHDSADLVSGHVANVIYGSHTRKIDGRINDVHNCHLSTSGGGRFVCESLER